MQAKQFRISIGGIKKSVVAIVPDLGSNTKSNLPTHHMFVIDRSGSMSGSLNTLIKQLHQAVDILGKDDLVTIAWFAGQGSSDIVVQASPVTPTVHKLIDSMNSTLGTTCFSEILGKLNNSNKALKDVCSQSAIHLFTDGNPVVPWSDSEELDRSVAQLKELCSNGVVAVNTIGYGNYYNRNMMSEMSSVSEFGQLTHSGNINQYFEILKQSIEVCSGLVGSGVEVFSAGSEILYVSKVNNLFEGHMVLNRLDKERNNIFVIAGTGAPTLLVDGEEPDFQKSTQSEEQDLIDNFFYAYAEQQYYRGHRQVALDIIVNNVKDKAIADAMLNAFTNNEVADVQATLRSASAGHRRFEDGKCSIGYLPKKDAFCVMDFFNDMIASAEPCYYIPYSKHTDGYERTTRKVADDLNRFKAADEEVKQSIDSLVWNKDRMNLSLRFKIQGTVTLNPKAAKGVGLDAEQKAFQYRTHTFVKDGQLNIKKAEFIVSIEVLSKLLTKAKKLVKAFETMGDGSVRLMMDLSKLPIINRTYIDNSDSLDDLLATTVRVAKLEAASKAVGIIIDEIYENGKASLEKKQGIFASYNLEQIRVLEEHGIRKDGTYGGIDNAVASTTESDSYETKSIIFQLKGAASLPSAADFKAMLEGTKKVNAPGGFMIEAYKNAISVLGEDNIKSPHKKDLEGAIEIDKTITRQLMTDRQHLASIKLAKILTGDFFHGLTQDNKGNYTYEANGNIMVVKTEVRKEYI